MILTFWLALIWRCCGVTLRGLHTAPQSREGGGFIVRRSIGSPALPDLDPFLMLDHLGPTTYGPGEAVGAPDHPHRGFETVTYVLQGGFQHKDSFGNEGNLGPGWVQWMTAGSGLVHSEMPSDELLAKGGVLEGFQLWVNLPIASKMLAPRYQDTPPSALPKLTTPDGLARVVLIAGEALGQSATISTQSPITFLDVQVEPNGAYEHIIPLQHNGMIYVFGGSCEVSLPPNPAIHVARTSQFLVLEGAGPLVLRAGHAPCRALLLHAKPLGEPVVRSGPFVLSTEAELRQAFDDYRNGKFGSIAGVEERYRKTSAAVKAQKKSGTWKEEL